MNCIVKNKWSDLSGRVESKMVARARNCEIRKSVFEELPLECREMFVCYKQYCFWLQCEGITGLKVEKVLERLL